MWKFSIICSFMAIFTGIALNLISNSIHDKRKQLSELEKRIVEILSPELLTTGPELRISRVGLSGR